MLRNADGRERDKNTITNNRAWPNDCAGRVRRVPCAPSQTSLSATLEPALSEAEGVGFRSGESHPTALRFPQARSICPTAVPATRSPAFHVSSGLVESKGQPFESTNRSHAPAICEVITAVITRLV
jgi:hypothetical protein